MKQRACLWGTLMLGALAPCAHANEVGLSFWRPGQLGSMAAVPAEPGWSLPLVYVRLDLDATDARELAPGTRLTTDAKGTTNVLLFMPTYTFERSLLGGQPSVGLGIGAGRSHSRIDVNYALPGGFSTSGSESDARWGRADLYPTANIKWNEGAHNYMVYTSGVLPTGSYRQSRLANVGENRRGLDFGAGYTYFNASRRMEFSLVGGVTRYGRNPDTDLRSGRNAHVDWAASYLVTPYAHAGLVGYFHRQLKGDSGSGAFLGHDKSAINGIGPQAGAFFELGGMRYHINAKAYKEWGAKNRAEGWNFWLILAMPFSAK